ncbi:MAG: hypothetical protein K2X77_32795 [Candidatus Obscuribacterales bacterium]|jgi:hypothetical protein|nr:hypothetical protein [Candidatus Obscuribacterales bacterium]
MSCFAGWTPEQFFNVAYGLTVVGGGVAFLIWQIIGISRDSDDYVASLRRQMRR